MGRRKTISLNVSLICMLMKCWQSQSSTPSQDPGVFRCAAYWEHLRFKAPALPLASCGISESPLPFPVPLCSYLRNEGIGLASPRQLAPVMPGGFKCLRSGWRDVRGKHGAGRGWLDLEMSRSVDPMRMGVKQIQRRNLEIRNGLCMNAVCFSERLVLQ